MRLIYITQSLPYTWALEDFFIPELKQLALRGHALLIVPRSPDGEVCGEERDLLVANSACEPLLCPKVLWSAMATFLRKPWRTVRLMAMLVRGGPGTVLRNFAVLPKGLWIAELATAWGATHIHAQWASTTATMGLVASLVSGIPWSFSAHRGDIVQNNLLALKCRSARFVRFISNSGTRLAAERGAHDREGKFHVIHLGVAVPGDTRPAAHQGGNMVVLCPANLIPVKGHKHLIEAIGLLKVRGVDCTLLLAGEGELRQELEALICHLALSDRISFLGQLPHHSLLAMYDAGEVAIVVLPSVDLGQGQHEGIPVSLMEAMVRGIPVVSTRTGGISELVSEDAGLLVPPADAPALANALAKLLTDGAARTAVILAARKRVRSDFSAEHAAAQLTRLIDGAA